ncbi:MAG: hypothetical protein CMP77_08865 [Flavobacterium sp.]|nr:hypothetical protein [Flavobacterium sp.]|tara:strand:+ start:790 stop:1395 length:606 start_codon:yes stop_codon:yes gene_type:complete
MYSEGGIEYIYSKRASSENTNGSQYFIENFNAARVDDIKELTLARYNAYTDEMELKIDDNNIVILNPKENTVVKLTNNRALYKFVQYTNEDGVASQNYLVVVSENPNVTIYKRERIELQPEQHPTGGYQKYKPAYYNKLNPEYYIQFNGGPIVYMSDKKKDVYSLIPGKEKEIKEYVKENRIDPSKDNDLKKLGAYLSTII